MYSIVYNIVNYNRANLAIKTLNSLSLNQIDYSLIHLIDDCSTDNIDIVKDFFSKKRIFNNNLLLEINNSNLGVECNNIQRLNNEIYNSQQFVYLSDNDIEFSSIFYVELQKLIEVMQNDINIFASTLFNYNTDKSCHAEIGNYSKEYVLKNSFGGCSILVRVKDFIDAMAFYLSKDYDYIKGWDWAFCWYAKKQNKKLVATKNSYVQHIGEIGVNSQIGNFDCANNFIK